MNKRLVQRAMQKLVDQNPSRPLHQHAHPLPEDGQIQPGTRTSRCHRQSACLDANAETTFSPSSGKMEHVA